MSPIGRLTSSPRSFVRVVLGRQAHAALGHEFVPGVVRARQRLFDHGEHFVNTVGPRHAQNLGHTLGDEVRTVFFGFAAQAAANNDAAVFFKRFGNCLQAFFNGFIDEAAGVDDDEVGVLIGRADAVAARAQLRHNTLGVDERLRAAERNKADDGNFSGHWKSFG